MKKQCKIQQTGDQCYRTELSRSINLSLLSLSFLKTFPTSLPCPVLFLSLTGGRHIQSAERRAPGYDLLRDNGEAVDVSSEGALPVRIVPQVLRGRPKLICCEAPRGNEDNRARCNTVDNVVKMALYRNTTPFSASIIHSFLLSWPPEHSFSL